MDSSSDGSFAWTDASNDTIDSEDKVNDKMNKPHSEDESVSGKSYKKKLQEELFTQSSRDLQIKEQFHHKEPKRKWSETLSEAEPQEQSPKKKKIKREPESDVDVSTSKYKMNGHNHSESHDSYDESYLNLEVKAEKHFAAPHPTKTKKNRTKSLSNSDVQHEESNETTNKKSKRKSKDRSSEETGPEDDTLSQLAREENEYHERKTKKKKKKSKVREDLPALDWTKPLRSEGEDEAMQDQFPEPQSDAPAQLEHTLGIETKKKKKKRLSKNSSTGDYEDTEDTGKAVNTSASSNIMNESVKRTPRISERIQFEEESSDVESMPLETSKPATKSSKLKTFLKDNLNLKTLTSSLKTESVLTGNDDVWIIRCPKDVDINAFQNKDFSLEGKCKLKLDGQTYEGTVDHEIGNMSILSSEQSHFVIKSISVKGFLNLRKRIPKSHFQEDAMMNNSQTNFIPLPETKCRHPLFGSNYRKAIKLPSRVTERLSAPEPEPQSRSECDQENGHHSASSNQLKSDPSPRSSTKQLGTDRDQGLPHKKNKKRKHSEDVAFRKKKRMKHNLESAEAWDSEQAIEENLFNF